MPGSAQVGALHVSLGIDTGAFSDGLKAAGTRLSAFGATLRKAIVPLVAVGTAAAAGLGVAVKSTINAADEMSKAAAKFGIPIETLSRLKYAADLSDVSLQGLGTAVGRLSRQMADAAGGSKEAVDAFAAVGVAFQNADGTLRPTEEVLNDIADRFAAMPDGAAKTAAAMELMGRSGAEMIPMLNGGAEALEKMKAEADTFGQVFTAEMGANAEQFNDNITRLQGAFGNIAADITERLLPYLAQFSDWLVENGPRFADVAVGFVEIGASLVPIGQKIGEVIKFVGDAIVWWIGVFESVPAAVTAARDAVVAFGESVANAINAFGDGAAAKIDAVVASFVSFGAGMYDAGASLLQNLWNGMVEKWETLKEGVTTFASDIVAIFQTIPAQMMQIGRDLLQGLWNGMIEKWESLKEGIGTIANGITSTFKGWLGIESPSTVFHEIGVNLMQGLGNGIISAGGVVTGALHGMAVGATNSMQGILGAGEQVAQGFGRINNKMMKVAQIFGAAQALISTYVGAAEALKLPFPANLAAAARVIAVGLGFVATIKSVSAGGGGGGGGRGGSRGASSSRQRVATPASGASAEKPKTPLDVRVQPLDPNALFTGKTVSDLLTSLQREAGDRGLRLAIA